MSATGRPPKLTPAVHKSIVESVRAGVPFKYAAQQAGVGDSTLRAWRAKGRDDPDGPFQALQAAIKKGEAEAVCRNTATMQKAAAERDEVTVKQTVYPDGTTETVTTTRRVFEWHAAAWWLERRHPEEFSGDKRELRQLRQLVRQIINERGGHVAGGGAAPTSPGPSVQHDPADGDQ